MFWYFVGIRLIVISEVEGVLLVCLAAGWQGEAALTLEGIPYFVELIFWEIYVRSWAGQHLSKNTPNRPDVGGLVIIMICEYNFWGSIPSGHNICWDGPLLLSSTWLLLHQVLGHALLELVFTFLLLFLGICLLFFDHGCYIFLPQILSGLLHFLIKLILVGHNTSHSQVTDADFALVIDQKVCRLHISVYHISWVEVVDAT